MLVGAALVQALVARESFPTTADGFCVHVDGDHDKFW